MRPALRQILFSNPYSAEAKEIFAAMTTQPTSARKSLIDAAVKSLKSAGVWSQLDCLYMLAAADSQSARLNWINPGTYTALAVNSPTFAADKGYTGDGSTSRLRTQYTPSVNGVNLTQNNASAWVWVLTNVVASTDDIGSHTAPRLLVESNNASSLLVGDVNSSAAMSASISTAIGLSGIQRRASSDRRLWKNGTQQGTTDTTASTAVANQEQWICGGNSTSFSTRQIACAAWGASLSGLESSLYNALLPYMQGIGAA